MIVKSLEKGDEEQKTELNKKESFHDKESNLKRTINLYSKIQFNLSFIKQVTAILHIVFQPKDEVLIVHKLSNWQKNQKSLSGNI